jgi:predicted permease
MDTLLQDIRFAMRSLKRRRTFAIVAIASIALSIGAATSIFSIVDGVLFRSLPYHDSGKLVSIWQTDTIRKKQALLSANWDRVPLDYTDFITWRERQTSFTAVGVSSGWGALRTDGPAAESVIGARVSPGFFEMLGVHPVLGGTFLPGEDVVDGPCVTMLSYEAWTSQFGAKNDVVGSFVRFDDQAYEIVGVLPAHFTLARGKPGASYWIPTGQDKGDVGKHNRGFRAIGRLRPGVTIEQASTETKQLLDANGPVNGHGVRISDFVRDETRNVRAPLLMLLGAVALLLLIACVNIATLLLGEAAARDVEMGTRVALGASRMRVVRQLLTESLLLAGLGSGIGVVLAVWGTKAIVAIAPSEIPGLLAAHVDGRILLAAFGAAATTGVLFGLAPAITLAGFGRNGSTTFLRTGQTVRGRGRLQRVMISAELALCVVLLVGAGLLTRSLRKLSSVDPGFQSANLLVVSLSGRGSYWQDSVGLRAFNDEVIPRLRAFPGVVAVTQTTAIPFSGNSSSSPYLLPGEGDADRALRKHEVQQRTISSNYFAMMGIPLIAGRAFNADDRASGSPVAIISEAAARRDFPTESAIGKQVSYQGSWRTIVGVARDVKTARLGADVLPSIYIPLTRRGGSLPDVIVRTRNHPAVLAADVRATLRAIDPNFVPTDARVMDDLIARSFAEERFRTVLIVLFGAMAAILASVGMFGVTARAVTRRTREVGIRVALGAEARSVVAMIVGQTLSGVSVGVLIGGAVAFGASRVLAPYLYGVTTHDPMTYVAIFALLAAVSALASWLPARRAGRVEPAVVLRGE